MDNKSNALAKDEMLAMIRHGANEVFKGKDDEFTDEDIDVILGRGEEKVSVALLLYRVYKTLHLIQIKDDWAVMLLLVGLGFDWKIWILTIHDIGIEWQYITKMLVATS